LRFCLNAITNLLDYAPINLGYINFILAPITKLIDSLNGSPLTLTRSCALQLLIHYQEKLKVKFVVRYFSQHLGFGVSKECHSQHHHAVGCAFEDSQMKIHSFGSR
jgi:hypothetical protein